MVTPPLLPPDFRWSSALWPGTGSSLTKIRYYIYIVDIFVYPAPAPGEGEVVAGGERGRGEPAEHRPPPRPAHAETGGEGGGGEVPPHGAQHLGQGGVTLHWTLLQQADLGRQVEAAGVHGGDHLLL